MRREHFALLADDAAVKLVAAWSVLNTAGLRTPGPPVYSARRWAELADITEGEVKALAPRMLAAGAIVDHDPWIDPDCETFLAAWTARQLAGRARPRRR